MTIQLLQIDKQMWIEQYKYIRNYQYKRNSTQEQGFQNWLKL